MMGTVLVTVFTGASLVLSFGSVFVAVIMAIEALVSQGAAFLALIVCSITLLSILGLYILQNVHLKQSAMELGPHQFPAPAAP